ncbi:Mrp/NBP35 family ATP-binding protein [Clostridium sp. 19966]|uniref:Mrp/NBP35 family ATP-binding protein n=1 Tax=Clostridium sp. 19966 TaxID=2768166 RepID=UPI0028DFBC37|nr:Mrp/NBP35 family ATP-binding protein [Clostridium sp. 19966]MDT8717281.1 Mrp/NBP35 family ATP-binding protein [Clostridium sp. 19966]
MSKCDTCPSKSSCSTKSNSSQCSVLPIKHGTIKNIIGIISGKGGVGKSTVTGLTAIELTKAGYKVGVLDADITGPSMPRIFGINKQRAEIGRGQGEDIIFKPVTTFSGIKVISMNLLTEEEEQPVIWRGPVINNVLNQLLSDTDWGDLDYLLIDMPPGTGDTALTVMQSFPIQSLVIVSTPQDMVSMIVKKVVIMAEKLNVPIQGVVENMSYVQCKCGEKIQVFSKTSAEEHAKYLGLELIAELPIDLDLSEALGSGEVERYIFSTTKYVNIIKKLV